MLAEKLKGRIRYNCTAYKGMDSCRIFEVCIDNGYKKQFSWDTLATDLYKKGYEKQDITWDMLADYIENNSPEIRDAHICREFCDALASYRKRDIIFSLQSDNPIERMFAILDRRVGKRTLEKLKEVYDEQPDWLKPFYTLRFEAENL